MKQLVMNPAYLFFLIILVFLGCGDALEKDTNLLAPEELLASEEPYRFQALPILEEGSLIPLDEIPVVSVELITEDPADGFFTWRLKANPVPTREDLVMLVYVSGWDRFEELFVIQKNQNSSKEVQTIIPDLAEIQAWIAERNAILPRLVGEGMSFSISIQSQAEIGSYLRAERGRMGIDSEFSERIFSRETYDGYVIPPDFIFPYYLRSWESGIGEVLVGADE